MPYYWTSIWNIYVNSSLETIKPEQVILDLTWFFMEQDEEILESLYKECNDGNYREPYPDENCQFKDWFEDISKAHFNFCGEGDNIMKILLEGTTSISSSNASSIIHLAPCPIIRKFIVEMTEFYLENDDDYDDYYSRDSVELVQEVRDGRQSPRSIALQSYYGLADGPVTSDEEEEDYDSMPELIDDEEEETEEDYDSEYEAEMEGCDCGWCKAARRSELAYQLYLHEYGNNPHFPPIIRLGHGCRL